jgi:hypothetical protein
MDGVFNHLNLILSSISGYLTASSGFNRSAYNA